MAWPSACGRRRSPGAERSRWSGRPAYIARAPIGGAVNIVLRGDESVVALLDGGLEAPWSVDVDPNRCFDR